MSSSDPLLVLDACTVDLARQVVVRDGRTEKLTTKEVELVDYLVRKPERTITRQELLKEVWGYAPGVVTRTLDTTIQRLRLKVEANPRKPVHVLTVFGTGYRFEPSRRTTEAAPPVAHVAPESAPARSPRGFRLGTLRVDIDRLTVSRDGVETSLTPVEGALLGYLSERATTVVGRAEILTEVLGYEHGEGSPRTVDVRVDGLRRKIEPDKSSPTLLVAVRGAGYRLEVVPEPWVVSGTTNVDADLTPLIGREGLVAAARAAMATDRLVTLKGPGGAGKTRLARELARIESAGLPGGAWFVDLAAASTREGMVAGLGRALELTDGSPNAVEQVLARRGAMLLVLDNLEQLVEAGRALVTEWLSRAPDLRILVTSRKPLGLPSEHVLEVGPLAPADAERLFLERARLAPGASFPEVPEIVARLECLPLAVELAAARTTVMAPGELLGRLDALLDLGVRGRGLPDRHATLRATVAWSWDQLEPWEQGALEEAIVFEGGFRLEAFEAVAVFDSFPAAPGAIDVLQSLADQSLVRSQSEVRTARHRFHLFEVVREYARERSTDPRVQEMARDRHLTHFAAIARSLARQESLDTLEPTRPDLDNLIAAFHRALALGHDDARSLGVLVAMLLFGQGTPLQRNSVLERTRAVPGSDPDLEAKLQWLEAGDFSFAGRLADALEAYRRSLDIADGNGLAERAGWALNGMGTTLRQLGRHREAREHLERSIRRFEEAGSSNVTESLYGLANLARDEGRVEEARAMLERAVREAEAAGRIGSADDARVLLGYSCIDVGELARAAHLFQEVRSRAPGHSTFLGPLIFGLGLLAEDAERYDEARSSYEEVLQYAERRGLRQYRSLGAAGLGRVLHAQGDLFGASRWLYAAKEGIEGTDDHRTHATAAELTALRLELGETVAEAEVGAWVQGLSLGIDGPVVDLLKGVVLAFGDVAIAPATIERARKDPRWHRSRRLRSMVRSLERRLERASLARRQ